MVYQDPSDGELLSAFLKTEDTAYLDELVRRHGPMVQRVCERVAGSICADDAAQAVFLAMVRRAESLAERPNIAGWLYRAAWNVASRSRRDLATRRANEREAARRRNVVAMPQPADDTMQQLHGAINALPEIYRDPIILHHLEGHTIEQVAGAMACPPGTVAARLSRGRLLLRRELEVRGIVLSIASLGSLLAAGEQSGYEGVFCVDWSARWAAMTPLPPAIPMTITRIVPDVVAASHSTLKAAVVSAAMTFGLPVAALGVVGVGYSTMVAKSEPEGGAQASSPDMGFDKKRDTSFTGGGFSTPEPATLLWLAPAVAALLKRRR